MHAQTAKSSARVRRRLTGRLTRRPVRRGVPGLASADLVPDHGKPPARRGVPSASTHLRQDYELRAAPASGGGENGWPECDAKKIGIVAISPGLLRAALPPMEPRCAA